jgi:uncharacterized membrane protein YecN with MAPEG domain
LFQQDITLEVHSPPDLDLVLDWLLYMCLSLIMSRKLYRVFFSDKGSSLISYVNDQELI